MTPVQVSQELIDDLVAIGEHKNRLPLRMRGFISDLGLYLQMWGSRQPRSLKAGGRFLSRINLVEDGLGGSWRVTKCKSGKWEHLVKPTLELAVWFTEAVQVAGVEEWMEYQRAVEGFRQTGRLNLPSLGSKQFRESYRAMSEVYTAASKRVNYRMQQLNEQIRANRVLALFLAEDNHSEVYAISERMTNSRNRLRELQAPSDMLRMKELTLEAMSKGIEKARKIGEFYMIHSHVRGFIEEYYTTKSERLKEDIFKLAEDEDELLGKVTALLLTSLGKGIR